MGVPVRAGTPSILIHKKNMKNYITYIAAAVILFLVIACGNKQKTRQEQIEDFRSTLTAEDTTQMLKLCDDAMESLKAKDYNKVLSSLYEYTDSTKEVKPLTGETATRYKRMFQMFPVLDYVRKYYSFQLEGRNDVKYEVTFATAEQAGTDEPATTGYMFNPVKVNGEWKLCVKTANELFDKSKR